MISSVPLVSPWWSVGTVADTNPLARFGSKLET